MRSPPLAMVAAFLPMKEAGNVQELVWGGRWEGCVGGSQREGKEKDLSTPQSIPSTELPGEHGSCVGKTLEDQELREDSMTECILRIFCLIFLAGVLVMSL